MALHLRWSGWERSGRRHLETRLGRRVADFAGSVAIVARVRYSYPEAAQRQTRCDMSSLHRFVSALILLRLANSSKRPGLDSSVFHAGFGIFLQVCPEVGLQW